MLPELVGDVVGSVVAVCVSVENDLSWGVLCVAHVVYSVVCLYARHL